MRFVAGLIVLLASCHVDGAWRDINERDEMGFIAKRQLKAMFSEFGKILKNKNVPLDMIEEECIMEGDGGNLREVVKCATKVFKSYMETIVKYDVFKDRQAKKEALKTFRAYLAFMRNNRFFARDDAIPLADAYESMIRFFGQGDYLNYSQEKFRTKY